MRAASFEAALYVFVMRLVLLVLALLVSACSMTPAYRRPAVALPASFNGGASGQATADAIWWQSFGSAELDGLVARSAAGNFDLRAAVARIDEARGKAEVAGASRYPTLDLGASMNQGIGASGTRVQSVFLSASYELDFWGKNRAKAQSAAALADASVFDAQTVELTLEASVADTYLQLLALDARLRLAKRVADEERQVLTLIEARAAGGIASNVEVEQQKNALATVEAIIPSLQTLLDQGVHQLAALSGEAPESFHIDGGTLMDVSVPRVGAGLPAALLERRPDIRAAEERLISANFDIGAARAAFFPSFTLTAQGGIGSASLADFFPPTAIATLVGGMAQPLFEGGRLEGQLRYDRAHAVELASTYRQTILNSLRDVDDALTATTRLNELEIADQAAVDSARRASVLARAQLEAGTADFLTVLTTERTEYQAEDALLQVRLQRLESAVGLFRALGGGFGNQRRTT
ncbi:MAG: outer membrane protein multidrug efflux system [Myxococcales bacterium]|nr:outer membrane protein multidrug efflux system [Myxococcales bacterium]